MADKKSTKGAGESGVSLPESMLYAAYRDEWATFKHPLPAWHELAPEALAVWKSVAVGVAVLVIGALAVWLATMR